MNISSDEHTNETSGINAPHPLGRRDEGESVEHLGDNENISSNTPGVKKPSRTEIAQVTIPLKLRGFRNWVLWRYKLDERGRWTKVPYHAKYSSRNARSNDSTTWSTYDVALSGYQNTSDIDGIGFVTSENNHIVGIDLDHCIEDTGEIEPWAQEIVDLLNSYAEISPSGHGLRIFVIGKIPGTRRRNGNIEAYDENHYLTVTGHHLPNTPTDIQDRQEQLNFFAEKYLAEDKKPEQVNTPGQPCLADDEVLEKAKNDKKFQKLFKGDWSDYPSQSEGDLAFADKTAFYTRKNPDQMDRLFRRSELMRPKWDEMHGNKTYGQMTIEKACLKCNETYKRSANPAELGDGEDGRKSQADILIKLAVENVQDFFVDQYRDPYARFKVGDHFEVWPIRDRGFKEWLSGLFYNYTGKGCNDEAMKTALSTCSAKARFDGGGEHELHVRVTEYEGALWYDLGDADWRSIRITADGWEIIRDTPILFRRLLNTGTQAEPVHGGNLDDIFHLVNIEDYNTQVLFKAWVLAAFIPNIPHPAVVIYGPQGSAKTSAFRAIKAILDPGKKLTDTVPGGLSDLVKRLYNQWFSGFDNLSTLPLWASDCFCRAITGDGYSERKLYTNNEEVILTFRRVIALNGINVVATRPDLLDRSILIGLERIEESCRLSEAEVDERMRQLLPGILGGALDLLVRVLKVREDVAQPIKALPRMADFALIGCALTDVIGLGSESFLEIYCENLEAQHQEVIENSPVAMALIKFMEDKTEWFGPPGDLLGELKTIGENDLGISEKSAVWPGAPNALTKKMNILKTNLAAIGISVEPIRKTIGRYLKVQKLPSLPSLSSQAASGADLRDDGKEKHTVITVRGTVIGSKPRDNTVITTPNRHDSVIPNHQESLFNDGYDGNEGRSPTPGGDVDEEDDYVNF